MSAAAIVAAAALAAIPARAAQAPRVASLDVCADQYVLALGAPDRIAALSMRATGPDSRLRDRARGLPRRRADLESVLTARPRIVVRSWGGDPRLTRALQARGVRIVSLEAAEDFAAIRRNIRNVAAALDRPGEAEALIGDMDRRLARAAGAWKGRRALYLTPAGFTAGPGTLTDEILRAAGLRNAERRRGYRELPLEALALQPPEALVLGYFDTAMFANASWAPGRHAVVRDLVRARPTLRLAGDLLTCPDWSAAAAAEQLAAQAPR